MLISVKTIRTNSCSGEIYEETGELLIRKDEKGIHVYMTKGGVTGFESFTVHPSHELWVNDWCACMGRASEYDTVTVPKEEMERAYREAGVIN